MVVQCGSGWTARDLSDSLQCPTSVPVHLFYLVVEGRVIDGYKLVRSLGRDRVVSTRGRVLGGSRNVSPIPGEWTCPGCMWSGCWPTKNTCFRCRTARPDSPLPPGPVLKTASRESPWKFGKWMPHGATHPPASSFFCSVSSFGARGGRVESRLGCSVLAWFECAACGVGGDPKCGSSSSSSQEDGSANH